MKKSQALELSVNGSGLMRLQCCPEHQEKAIGKYIHK